MVALTPHTTVTASCMLEQLLQVHSSGPLELGLSHLSGAVCAWERSEGLCPLNPASPVQAEGWVVSQLTSSSLQGPLRRPHCCAFPLGRLTQSCLTLQGEPPPNFHPTETGTCSCPRSLHHPCQRPEKARGHHFLEEMLATPAPPAPAPVVVE